MEEEKRPQGRPEIYTKELGERICELLAQGKSLRSVCLMEGMPCGATIFSWFRKQDGFLKQYELAKQESSDALAEEIMDIADDAHEIAQSVDAKAAGAMVQASRLKVDTRKWLMAKMKPKKYGEKLDLSTNGKDLPTPLLYAIQNDSSKEKEV